MSLYHIIRFPFFIEQFNALDEVHQERIRRIVFQLSEKGSLVGKPLGLPFLREKKFNGNRLYFLFYAEWNVVLLVALSDKKDQSTTIVKIKTELSSYRQFVYEQLKEMGLI